MSPGQIVFQSKSIKSNPILIRYIQKGDEQSMMDYINDLSKEQTFVRSQGEQFTFEEETKYVDGQIEMMANKTAVNLLVFSNEKLIGVSSVKMKEKIEKHVGVFAISISKAFRGEGIGRILMEQVLKEAESNLPDLKIITLGVFANNPLAKSLYEKLGFKEYGSLPKGILHKGEYVDHIDMYKMVRDF